MKRLPLFIAACAIAAFANTPSVFESDREFRLRTHLEAGLSIEIEGVNGDLVAETSTSGDVEVLAVRKDGSVRPMRLSVREHNGGTTVSAIQHRPRSSHAMQIGFWISGSAANSLTSKPSGVTKCLSDSAASSGFCILWIGSPIVPHCLPAG